MPFSSSFCLTNIGNLPSSTSVNIYSNINNYTIPFQTGISLSNITGTNCPYVLTGIPDGTTTLQIKDINSYCCVTIPISANSPCTFCKLGFDVFSASTIGRIVAGNLTGSCSANITDYVIEWYETSNPNVIVFTSGKGTAFLPYGYSHPLTGVNSYLVAPGIYKPYLRKVRINGTNYSNTVLTGFVQANLDCFTTVSVTVTPLTCSNGTLINDDYTHLIEFSGASQGIIPSTMRQVFQLSPNTNYFAWRFWGYDIADTIKLTYYGSRYNNLPIILEYWNVGFSNFANTNYSSFPKISSNSAVQTVPDELLTSLGKVTCLTGITRSVNDYIVVDILPNQQNNKTNFKLKTKCLTSFNCVTCFDNFRNSSAKFIQNQISVFNLGCNRTQIQLFLSGCSESKLSTSDLYKYVRSFAAPRSMTYPTTNALGHNFVVNDLSWGSQSCGVSTVNYSTLICVLYDGTNNNNFISFKKDNSGPGGIGNVRITCSSQSDFNAYYNSYLNQQNLLGPIPTDPTTIGWYSYIQLTIPEPTTSNDPCGDTTTSREYYFHRTTTVTTGITSGNYFMNLTMPKITKQINFTNCQINCNDSVNFIVNGIKNSSESTPYNYSNSKGNRFQIPFNGSRIISIFPSTANTVKNEQFFLSYSKIMNETIPFSANTNGTFSYINSLSAITCNFNTGFLPVRPRPIGDINYDVIYQQCYSRFKITLTNPSNPMDFKIEASPITNGWYQYSGTFDGTSYPTPIFTTIYQRVNGVGTVLNSNYFI